MGLLTQDDSVLVHAVIAGNPTAWERFVGAYGDPIYAICVSFVGNALADELFAAYFGQLRQGDFRALKGYQAGKGILKTYLVCDAHSYCMKRALADYLHRPAVVEAVWHQLEAYYKPSLLRTIEGLLQRAEHADLAADDLYQHLLVHLMEDDCARLRKFSGEGSFRAWLRQVATNFVVDRLRQAPARAVISIQGEQAGTDREGVGARLAVDPPDPGPLPDQQMEAALESEFQEDRLEAMGRALPELSERSQLCLRMKYWEEQKPSDMADLMGEPVGKVYKVLEKNMEKLRAKMDAQPPRGKSQSARPIRQGGDHPPHGEARPT
jgi:RNA polymerase sigma factor (sigma-70 family)